jgi:hypothetical protein
MHLSITDNVTQQDKNELLTGLRAYNGQFLDLTTFSGYWRLRARRKR